MKLARNPSSEIGQRVHAFKTKFANHDHLEAAKKAAWTACSRVGGEKVVIITGSTGVGKSTLARRLYVDLKKRCQDEIDRHPDVIPVVGVSAVAPTGRAFSWKDFYIRLLFQARDPVSNRALLAPTGNDMFGDSPYDTPADRMLVDKLRRCVEITFKRRKTRWLIIDEAHHILLHKDPHVNQIVFEALKSLAIETGLTIVLCGTYKLLDIRDQSAQLVRRSDLIHFQRYDLQDRRHHTGFARALRTFEEYFDLPEPVALARDWQEYFIRSIGCVGILKDWLAKVYESALEAQRPTIDLEFALSSALSNKELITIAKEARAGEAKLLDVDDRELRDILIPPSEASAAEGCQPEVGGAARRPDFSESDPTSRAARKRHAGGRVGQRAPCRDVVGRPDLAA